MSRLPHEWDFDALEAEQIDKQLLEEDLAEEPIKHRPNVDERHAADDASYAAFAKLHALPALERARLLAAAEERLVTINMRIKQAS